MTKQTISNVEERFLNLRKQFTQQQWRDPEVLNKKVDELSATDLPLAHRLMQRIKNIQPGNKSRQKITHLKRLMQQDYPELMVTKSTDNAKTRRVKASAKIAVDKLKLTAQNTDWKQIMTPFVVVVLVPFLLFTFYQVIWASERFESRTQLIIKQPDGMSTLDPAMAMLSGFTGTSISNDNELVKAFILSADMIAYLQSKLDLREHYSSTQWDVFSRLSSDASQEDLHEFYGKIVKIEIDDASSLITISVQGFESLFSQQLAKMIVERAEWYINEIGHALAKEQLSFVLNEHQMVEKRLQSAKSQLLAFQRKHDLLDPEAEGMAFQQIAYQLEGEIASTQAKLSALLTGMSEKAPQVMRLRAQLDSLEGELTAQRSRLSSGSRDDDSGVDSVGEILAKFSDLKIDMELALKAYASSQVSLEKSRIEAYRQLKYLVTVETPTQPDEAKYPAVFYNISLFLAVALMLFAIGRIIIATVSDLR